MIEAGQTYPTNDMVDVVVIGTGCGGAPLLDRLVRNGLSVVALEAGRHWDGPRDYAQDEVEQRSLYWLDERLSDGKDPIEFGKNNSGCGVGGSSLHYGAFAPRPDPRDLYIRSDFGVGCDWPMPYGELAPFLEEVERFLGVSGPADYPWDCRRRYPLPPLPFNAPARLMERGCRAVGIRTCSAPLLTLSKPYSQPDYDERPVCGQCGFCHQGCFNRSKASMDVTYLQSAARSGAEIRAECFAHAFDRNSSGAISAVVYKHDGKDISQKCRAVFLCAGAVETPRLLLHAGLANSSGQVGRNFMAHVATQVWGTFAEEVRCYRGFPASLITEDFIRPADADFAGGYLVQSLGIVPVTFAGQVVKERKLWGKPLLDYLQQYNHVAGIGINGDCLPDANNFLELSDELDGRGMRKPLIHFSMTRNESKMRDHADRTMRGVWNAADASDIWTCNRLAHTIGTCRMGTDRSHSVVDPYGQSFDIPNLWISDNSAFPSALAANPALTIMALSLRSADRFLNQL